VAVFQKSFLRRLFTWYSSQNKVMNNLTPHPIAGRKAAEAALHL